MKQTRFKKSALSTAVSAAILLPIFSFNATAEGTDTETAEQNDHYETLEVTATRRTESIMDVPINISAVDGEDLADGNIVDAAEMLRNVAGITVVDRGYRNSGAVNGVIIRGVNVDGGANGDVALSAVPTVSTYINETPLFANFILKDIQQAEVLRGPQGTLYGSGSLAGTVRYRMNKPDLDDQYGSASISNSVTKGSEGFNTNVDVLYNMPITDTVAVRANAGKIKNAGIVDYTNIYQQDANGAPLATGNDIAAGTPLYESVEDADTVDITYARASALWEATDDLSVLLSVQNQKDETGGRRQVTRGTNWVDGTEQAYGDYENGAVMLEPSEREVSLMALEVEFDMGFATLSGSASNYNHQGSATSDNTGFYAKQNWFNSLYYGTPRPMAKADRGYDEDANVLELRLVSNGDSNIDWTAGVYYMDQARTSDQQSYMPGYINYLDAAEPAGVPLATMVNVWGMIATDQDFNYRRDETFTDAALFGEMTYHFSDTVHATVGLRAFDNTFENDTLLEFPIWPDFADTPFTSYDTSDSGVLKKVNVSWNMSDDQMLYGTISEGYRRGGANAVPLSGNLAERPEWQNYESDRSVNSEIGLKGFIGNGHAYTLSAFNMDWKDPQLNSATTWGFFAATNGESANTQGIELELQGYLSDKVHYVAGAAFVKAELTADLYTPSGVGATEPLKLQAAKGSKLPSTPEATISLAVDYSESLSNGMYWTTQLSGYYQSSSVNYLGESDLYQADIDGFSIFNLNSKVSYEDFDVSIFVKNILNEDGVTGLITENHMGTAPGAAANGGSNFAGNSSKDYISQPRTIGMKLGYKF